MQAFDGKYYKSDCLGHQRRFASYTVYTVAQCGAVKVWLAHGGSERLDEKLRMIKYGIKTAMQKRE